MGDSDLVNFLSEALSVLVTAGVVTREQMEQLLEEDKPLYLRTLRSWCKASFARAEKKDLRIDTLAKSAVAKDKDLLVPEKKAKKLEVDTVETVSKDVEQP